MSKVGRTAATGRDGLPNWVDEVIRYKVRPQEPKMGSGVEVWRAIDLLTEDPVAIKIMRLDRVNDQDLRDRLQNEAIVGARLSGLHPNILRVRDLGLSGDRLFIATDWIDGGSLRRLCGRLSIQSCVNFVSQCGSAVRAAYRKRVLHTDLCPDNLLYVEKDREILVADFGLATALEGHATSLGRISPVRRRPSYMPPEGHPVHPPPLTPALDTYALATTFRTLLTGHEDSSRMAETEIREARTGAPVPGGLIELINRYTFAATSKDTIEKFMRDLWEATE
jgi:serine/threonine protein kinase